MRISDKSSLLQGEEKGSMYAGNYQDLEAGGGEMKMPYYPRFMEKQVRNLFMRNVFMLVALQLVFTFSLSAIFINVEKVKLGLWANSWLIYCSWGASFATVIWISCSSVARRTYPWNYVALSAFTATNGFMVAMTTSYYDSMTVLIAIGITLAIVVGLVLFSLQTKYDFTMISGFLYAGLLSILIFGFLMIFFHNKVAYVVYSTIGALLFSAMLVHDIHVMMGAPYGKRMEMDPEDYVYGSIIIYLDVINLFLHILNITGIARS